MGNTWIIRLILLVVFLAWLLVWVLLPTKLYKNTWTPKLNMKLNSTYFGTQGTNLLLFSFPVMFIAALGSVYLHFQKNKQKQTSGSKSNHRLSFLSRPVLVMAPLGIVTAMEVAFATMFIALLIWSLANYLYISFGSLHMHKEGEKVWEAKFRSVSLRLGYIGNVCWAFLFIPVTRGSSLLPLVGLTSESSIKYHIWLGHLSNLLFAAHTVGFFIYWAMTHQMALALEWSKTYVSNVAGVIAMVIGVVMWVASFYRTRRKMFELFFYTHQLYILYILFYALHVGAAYLCMIFPGIFLFLIDRYLRFLQSRKRARLVSARVLPCGVVELNFSKSKDLRYNPTSILFVNVPSISKLQWHPFTITSNCDMEPDRLSVFIKTQGSWSENLYQKTIASAHQLELSVEGPYGPTSSNFLRHELLVMVSGGSGLSPFISIIRQMIYESSQPNSRVPQVLLVCSFKNSADLAMLDLLLPINGVPADLTKLQLKIEAYVTREKEKDPLKIQLQTKWFKPNPSDSAITAALGPNNWLWLGAVIASSFVMFLLLLGIITRYYIFPMVDMNAGDVYHYSFYILWDLFLGCVCVFLASSAAFLWFKKENVKEQNQIQNLEIPSPTASPGSWFHSADRELESLPHQSLVDATEVHFGERPDLKRILFECKASDVGVLACGPRAMRHEVAKICSAGLAENLHFESISFNW
ncbi:ferric reduction oxidase 4-like [Mercurialis annua]|uniref:ferric reduction oxidase 4-like n=1 Tax=Mercurialis annua TaxID=3986 RepID=UPI00215E5B41|nr:ferric reduction oxidase 4-like [Mercurialis annua]